MAPNRPAGRPGSPLEMEEVVFGMRCSITVKYTIVRALVDRPRPVKFYEIRERRGKFLLGKYVLDTDELMGRIVPDFGNHLIGLSPAVDSDVIERLRAAIPDLLGCRRHF